MFQKFAKNNRLMQTVTPPQQTFWQELIYYYSTPPLRSAAQSGSVEHINY